MPENLSVGFQSLLDTPIISRVRRNHGLEHATLHVLAERHPGLSIAGHSNPGGFWILGDVSTEEVRSARTCSVACSRPWLRRTREIIGVSNRD